MRKRFKWLIYVTFGLIGGGANFCGVAPVAAQMTNPNEPSTVLLTLSPAAEPVPALKYRLRPPVEERTKGNAALAYYRAVVQFEPMAHGPNFAAFISDKVQPWLQTPLDSLPQEEVARSLGLYESVLKELERGSRHDECRWDLPLESDGINTLLGEFQDLRWPGQLLALRARLEMARGDMNAVLATLRVSYQLARNLATARTFIPPLVGVAIAAGNRAEVETFVQQPGAPNLYWALTELPVPLVDFRSALEMESRLPDYAFPEIREFRSRRLSKEEAHRISERLLIRWRGINDAGDTVESIRTRFAVTAAAEYTADKQTLIAAGRPKSQVEAMAVEQVVWLAADFRWQVYSDELFKWSFLPVSQRSEGFARAEQRVGLLESEGRGSPFEFVELLPAVGSVMTAMDRTDRGIALLRTVEAIRLHAALHGGELPNSLDNIDAVPIPTDPMTGRPFIYRLQDGGAVLETPPVSDNKHQGRRYLIRMRK
jgi:hypothetical protein